MEKNNEVEAQNKSSLKKKISLFIFLSYFYLKLT